MALPRAKQGALHCRLLPTQLCVLLDDFLPPRSHHLPYTAYEEAQAKSPHSLTREAAGPWKAQHQRSV